MNFPWLEYEKWCITSWYTVKPDFCPILPDFSGKNRIPDPEKWITDLEIYAKLVKNTLKFGFFRISGKSGSRIRNFFGLKPSRDQDGANKKKFSQIGPAVPEEIGHKHTNTQANIVLLYKRD